MDYNAIAKLNALHHDRIEALTSNPTPRVPIALCLDVSATMATVESGTFEPTGKRVQVDGHWFDLVNGGVTRIDLLQDGVREFYTAIQQDDIAMYSAEVCIVSFNDKAQCLLDFANLDLQDELPHLTARGSTAMGEGLNLSLDLLEQRKKEFQDNGVDYFQPWLVILTDGEPNAGAAEAAELARAEERIRTLTAQHKLTVLPIGVGNEANLKVLSRFSADGKALRLQGLEFQNFFQWLGKSVVEVSQSTPGDCNELDTSAISGWESL